MFLRDDFSDWLKPTGVEIIMLKNPLEFQPPFFHRLVYEFHHFSRVWVYHHPKRNPTILKVVGNDFSGHVIEIVQP